MLQCHRPMSISLATSTLPSPRCMAGSSAPRVLSKAILASLILQRLPAKQGNLDDELHHGLGRDRVAASIRKKGEAIGEHRISEDVNQMVDEGFSCVVRTGAGVRSISVRARAPPRCAHTRAPWGHVWRRTNSCPQRGRSCRRRRRRTRP